MADSPPTPNDAIKAGEGDFIERLLAGPVDPELSPRDLALLRAHLNQPVSLAQRRREARAEGRLETAQRRKKLELIYNFNRYLQAESPDAIESESGPADRQTIKADARTEANSGPLASNPAAMPKKTKERGDDHAVIRLLSVYTNGLADERLGRVGNVLNDDKLSMDEKLWKIDVLMPIPPTVSAAKLGKALGVSKTAVQKTTWYLQKCKGQKDNEIGRRQEQHRQRGQQYEPDRQSDDD